MNRREFVKYASSAAILLANGEILNAHALTLSKWKQSEVALRFVVASDGHYGEKGTAYEKYFDTLVNRINEEHSKDPFAFCMINGDIIHDDKNLYPAAKAILDKLKPGYYVSQGNHDHVTALEWEKIWNIPVNFDFVVNGNAFLIATTSNETGDYLCPDINWIKSKLIQYQQLQNIFIFLHINPGKLTQNAIDCPELFEVFGSHKNIRGIFNGHDHDEEGIKTRNDIPFIFDAHFGGSWGTTYRGFRVVELMKDNSVRTYIMNPNERINEIIT